MHRNAVAFDRERAARFNEWAGETLPLIVPLLNIDRGHVVADVGAGGGAFTVAFARAAGPTGRAVAIDSYPEMLAFVTDYAAEALDPADGTVETLLLPHSGENMPVKAFDLVFMRQVYHHLDEPAEYLSKVRDALKPGGRVAIIDFIPGSGHGPTGHAVSEDEIRRTAGSIGLELTERFDSLTEFGRSFTIYRVHTSRIDD